MGSAPRLFAVVAMAIALGAGTAHAASITYADRMAWEASTDNVVNRDFEGYAGNSNHLGTFTDNGVTFASSNNYIFSWGPVSGYDIGSGKWILGPWNNGNIGAVSFASPTTSAGVDLALYASTGGSISIWVDLLNGTDFGYTATVSGYQSRTFFGLTVDGGDSIQQIIFQANGSDNVILDNFATGDAAAPIPEPTSMLLLGSGLAALAARRRRAAKR